MNANERSLAEEITEGLKALESMRNDKLEKCPSCEYHKSSEKIWRDLAKKQVEEIEYWKEKFNTAMSLHTNNTKPAKYTDEWWKEVAEFNKQLREQEK